MKIGVNWSGQRATGYDIEPIDVQTRIEYEIGQLPTVGQKRKSAAKV